MGMVCAVLVRPRVHIVLTRTSGSQAGAMMVLDHFSSLSMTFCWRNSQTKSADSRLLLWPSLMLEQWADDGHRQSTTLVIIDDLLEQWSDGGR